MKMLLYFALTLVSLLATACADSIPDMNVSPGSIDGDIQNIEIETTATPDASNTVGAGMDGTSPSGSPQNPSYPEGNSANNQDSPANPAPNSPAPGSPVPNAPAPRCVPQMQMKEALISVFWSRRNGEAAAVEVMTVKVTAADAAEKLAGMQMKLQTYKELLRTGWGNMQLNVALCQDANKDGRCGKDEQRVELFSVRAPTFIGSRYPMQLGKSSLQGGDSSSDAMEDSSSEEDDSCEAKPLKFTLSASAQTERNCHIKINRKYNTPVVLKLSF